MVDFTWTITLGQVIGTGTLLCVIAFLYGMTLTIFNRERARLAELEKQVAVLQEAMRITSEVIKISEGAPPDDQ
jgi:uncharacterized membrane protein